MEGGREVVRSHRLLLGVVKEVNQGIEGVLVLVANLHVVLQQHQQLKVPLKKFSLPNTWERKGERQTNREREREKGFSIA